VKIPLTNARRASWASTTSDSSARISNGSPADQWFILDDKDPKVLRGGHGMRVRPTTVQDAVRTLGGTNGNWNQIAVVLGSTAPGSLVSIGGTRRRAEYSPASAD
jgi:hypothetical protein